MSGIEDGSINLVVTSPPYPMIQMWDEHFCAANAAITEALKKSDGDRAFNLMHQDLDGVWKEMHRTMAPGAIACINIGDATRTIQGKFRLYANHARIISCLQKLGLCQLPAVLWRKTTNAPNKFMGSGMMPPGAYVTLEHEYILIFRKGAKREFPDERQKLIRRQSAYFWEERNNWFSDVWTGLPGTLQNFKNTDSRLRSAAFPFELAYRLINMFSVKGDIVLDPFLGSGTTLLAAMCACRHSVGYEIDDKLQPIVLERIAGLPDLSRKIIEDRLEAHHGFIKERSAAKGDLKYHNTHYGFPVMTRQEQDLYLDRATSIQYLSDNRFCVDYMDSSLSEKACPETCAKADRASAGSQPVTQKFKGRQLKLF